MTVVYNCTESVTEQIGTTAEQMVSGKEEEEAPRKCVKCDQNLPRESFSRKQWQNTPLKRRCSGCTDVTQAEETNKKIKKLPPKEIWNMDKMN